jgi:CheY-like chemotaxis protein
MTELRLNFTDVTALVVDRDPYSLALTRQILRGFGVASQFQASTGAEAQNLLLRSDVDLCLIEADLPDMTGFDVVRWMRRRGEQTIRFVPILILSGYTQMRSIAASRDCGANAVVRKPFSPRTMFDHIAWAAGSKRPYLDSPAYLGPDRRFRGEAEDAPQRRLTDRNDDAAAEGDGTPDDASGKKRTANR